MYFKWEQRTEITYGKSIAYNVAFMIKKIKKRRSLNLSWSKESMVLQLELPPFTMTNLPLLHFVVNSNHDGIVRISLGLHLFIQIYHLRNS